MAEIDNDFLKRADALISLANSQMTDGLTAGDISDKLL